MTKDLDSVVHNDHVEGEAEHVFWLDDAEKWKADHRKLLHMLMQVQSAIFEEDAALDAHIRDIHLHEKARLRHELLEASAGSQDLAAQAALEDMHRRLEIKHARARAAHGRMSNHHDRLVELVERLLAATREPM